jgi:hydroxymethylpyrimidine/phosphomethylpyrimidine kinase
MPKTNKRRRPVVLSIAGYDPSSGAGITADIKTMAAHGCYGVTCITALTVQSTRGVRRVEPVAGQVITGTLEELADDMEIAAVKIGMLTSADAACAVTAFLKRHQPHNVVLDPVLMSSSGAQLLSGEGVQTLKENLLALALVITPNIDEAAALTGMPVANLTEMASAAAWLQALGARNVVITGGHLNPPVDLISRESSKRPMVLTGKKVACRHGTHGTGCAFSTALACNLALGKDLLSSIKNAKRFVEAALRKAPGVGKGLGPVI